jgi:hypothetical protein
MQTDNTAFIYVKNITGRGNNQLNMLNGGSSFKDRLNSKTSVNDAVVSTQA